MPDDAAIEAETLRELAAELSMPLDDETRDEVLAYATELDEAFDERTSAPTSSGTPTGTMSDDEYNALLAVYDEPRTAERGGGRLDGLTVAVKDNIAVRDLTMTCGSVDFSHVPSTDAAVVDSLLDEGAAIVGKANMDAYAFGPAGEWSEFGRVINPTAEGHVPGGSSSGSGAAVASGLVDAALGTDTGGSVRVPAACCGVVGVKPSHRLVPRHGFVGNVPFTDTIGPLARDVGTAARMLDAMAGPDPRDPTSMVARPGSVVDGLSETDQLTVGLVENTLDLVEDTVATVTRNAASGLESHDGVTVTPVELEIPDVVDYAFSLIIGADYAWSIRQSTAMRGEGSGYDPELTHAVDDRQFNRHISGRVLPGALLDRVTNGRSYVAARQEAIEFTERMNGLFDRVDVLLAPTLRMTPPEYGEVQSSKEGLKYSLCKPFSLTGSPAVSVPAAFVDGLPMSVQFVAPVFEDARALRCAQLVEANADEFPLSPDD